MYLSEVATGKLEAGGTMAEQDLAAYISAQVISQNGGNVTCEITSRGDVIATAEARGFAKIATCSGLAE